MSYLRIFHTAVLLFSTFCLKSQELHDSTLVLVKNEPQSSFTSFGISLGAILSNYNSALFIPGLQYNLFTPRFAIAASGNIHVFERIGEPKGDEILVSSIHTPSFSRDFSISSSFFFWNRNKSKNIAIAVSPSRFTFLENFKMASFVADVNRKWAVDFGAKIGFTSYNFNTGWISGINNSGNQFLLGQSIEYPVYPNTIYEYAFFKFGFNFTSINNLSVKAADRIKYKNNMFQFYGHLYVPAYNNVDDIYCRAYNQNSGEYYYVQFDIRSNMTYRRIGGAIGFSYIELKKRGMAYNAELGIIPGPWFEISDVIYFNFNVKFSLGKFLKKTPILSP